ncbi:MAG: hypothetical protein ABFS86_11180 [Planctomycetota bacterium]
MGAQAAVSPELKQVANAVRPFIRGVGRLKTGTCDRTEDVKTDAFGNAGTLIHEKFHATVLSQEDREGLVDRYLDAGFAELPRDSLKEDDQIRFRLDRLDPSNPFIWEHEAQVAIGGRNLVGSQRKVLAAKLESLRKELAEDKVKPARREQAEKMVEELEGGMLLRLRVELSRRSFVLKPLLTSGHTFGTIVPISFMSQLVYSVMPADPADREEDDGDPLYLTILGADERQVSFLFSGGILGQRTVTDLEAGAAHHAWFANRQATESPDTAPWISRRVYRELRDRGESSVIIKWGREDVPIHIAAKGSENLPLVVSGEERSVPTLVAETEKEDRLWILEDQDCPLVLKLIEEEADLLRSIDEVRRLDAV